MDVNITIDEPPFDIHHPSRETIPLPPGKNFHIFFSYRDVFRDKLWVKRVIDKLETEYGYTCCDHERDFLPGTKIMDNIKYGLKNSDKVVIVFSKEAMDSHYVSLEADMAYQLRIERRKNVVIPVLLDDCDVPEEFMLLTYIDAREGVEETTWWPKLIKSIKSTGEESRSPFYLEGKNVAADKTFAITQLCSIETKFSFLRCSIQANSKHIPAKLRPQSFGVPVDLIRATNKDLLQSPSVVCRQKCCCFARIYVVFGYLIVFLFLLYLIFGIYYFAYPAEDKDKDCIPFFVASIFLMVVFGPCYLSFKLIYLKNPDSVHNNIIDYNRILSKYGVMVTVVPGYLWRTASLIFYKCRFDLCKEYVIRHLAKEGSTHKTEHKDIPDSGQMTASTDGSWLLSGIGKLTRHREQSIPIVNEINPVMADEAEDVSDVADDKPLLSNQETANLDYENKALELLMWCTPEYLDLAYANKLKNPKEDRHGIELMCLCQYLEEAHKGFREKVKRSKSLRLKADIEENYQDEANKHFENIML